MNKKIDKTVFKKNIPICISMVTWNRPEFTKRSIEAIKKNTNYPHRIHVIDNGSEGETQDMLWQMYTDQKIDLLLLLEENYGLEYAKNLGLDYVKSKYHISTDNDILPQKGWLEELVKLMDENPKYKAIALRPQILIGSGNIFEGKKGDIVEYPHVPGYCRIMDTKLVKDIGGWRNDLNEIDSEKFRQKRGHEELYISGKIRERGYKVGWARNVKCHHLFGNNETDPWGYIKEMKPQDHGHNEVSHIPPSPDKVKGYE
jgi:glycosyltransferase involved in cell wall biosynthesis